MIDLDTDAALRHYDEFEFPEYDGLPEDFFVAVHRLALWEKDLVKINSIMQSKFPGNYELIYRYNDWTQRMPVVPEFKTIEDKTAFMLKNL